MRFAESKMMASNATCLEQLLYVLCNVTAGPAATHKDSVMQRPQLVAVIVSYLRHPIARVKVAALWCIINITAPDAEGSKARQVTRRHHWISIPTSTLARRPGGLPTREAVSRQGKHPHRPSVVGWLVVGGGWCHAMAILAGWGFGVNVRSLILLLFSSLCFPNQHLRM